MSTYLDRDRPFTLQRLRQLPEEAPGVFALDGSGVATLLVAETDDEAVLDAAGSCPMGAITVYETRDRRAGGMSRRRHRRRRARRRPLRRGAPRRRMPSCPITVVGAERVAPYERPALSKEFLAGHAGARTSCCCGPRARGATAASTSGSTRPSSASTCGGASCSMRGSELAWSHLVLATGARARQLPGVAFPNVHCLRTLADAVALRAAVRPDSRLVVVGAGFVGAEVASTATRSRRPRDDHRGRDGPARPGGRRRGRSPARRPLARRGVDAPPGRADLARRARQRRARGRDVDSVRHAARGDRGRAGVRPARRAPAGFQPTAAGARRSTGCTRAATWHGSTAVGSSTGRAPRGRRRPSPRRSSDPPSGTRPRPTSGRISSASACRWSGRRPAGATSSSTATRHRSGRDTSTRKGSRSPCCSAIVRRRSRRRGASSRARVTCRACRPGESRSSGALARRRRRRRGYRAQLHVVATDAGRPRSRGRLSPRAVFCGREADAHGAP